MKGKLVAEEQIIRVLREVEAGAEVIDVAGSTPRTLTIFACPVSDRVSPRRKPYVESFQEKAT